MLKIDGSRLEGGGQVVRVTVALSALTREAVTITRIRANRPKRGLMAQHLAAVRAVAACCGAECEGLEVGSETLVFRPEPLRRTETTVDVGTAGSIPLVLQAWLPVGLAAGGSIRVSGGTEVEHSPTIDYTERVLLGTLRGFGASAELEILKRGYYPEGGGEVHLHAESSNLSPLAIGNDPAPDAPAAIVSCTSNLPDHVAARQASAAEAVLAHEGIRTETVLVRQRGRSTGTSCTVCRGPKGASALGRRGLPAERVGALAAEGFLHEHRQEGGVDTHLSDQLLIFLACYGGSYTCAEFSMHAQTVCWLLSEFGLGVEVTQGILTEFSA